MEQTAGVSETQETAVKNASIRARTGTGINWVGAFLMYAKGATLQELSESLAIDLKKLMTRARSEDWDNLIKSQNALALRAPSVTTAPQGALVLKDAAARIMANREEAFSVASRLRKQISAQLQQYEDAKIYLSPGDILTLARAASTLDASSMQALGDDPSPKLPAPPEPPGGKKDNDRPVAHFHITMPAAAAAPRRVGPTESVSQPEVPAKAADPFGARAGPPIVTETVEISPEAVESEFVETTRGRQSVDFTKLGKVISAVVPPTRVSVPEMFK